MSYLWRTDQTEISEQVMRFMAGDDVVDDRQLLLYDIQATVAHVEGLARIDVLSDAERTQLVNELQTIAEQFAHGKLKLTEDFEDGHSAIETWLVERLGKVGEKVHTGRSRNDQVLVATRLYLRDSLSDLSRVCRDIAVACLAQARDNETVAMPGYTHLQRAVVSSLGVWFAGYAEAFIDNASLTQSTRAWVDANPLGTAAGYGVNLPLDREYTTTALGFERMQINPMYVQNSRGKFELQALAALSQALLDVRRFAWDLSLFSSAEFGFAQLPDAFTTGSSIMPNKRNPDLVELLRATHGTVQGAITEIQGILSLPGGYHRDLQATKGPLLRAFNRGLAALACTPALVRDTRFDRERLEACIEPAMYATDRAVDLCREGVPFRSAYRQIKQAAGDPAPISPAESIAARVSAGAAGNLCLDVLDQRLQALSAD